MNSSSGNCDDQHNLQSNEENLSVQIVQLDIQIFLSGSLPQFRAAESF